MLGRMFGADAIRDNALAMGLTTLSVATPQAFEPVWGSQGPDAAGRSQYMAALGLRVRNQDRTAKVLRDGGVAFQQSDQWLRVAARDAFGVALEFRE